MATILIAEDDHAISDLVAYNLERCLLYTSDAADEL